MSDGQIVVPKHRERERAARELVAKGAYSVIIVVLALVVLRPLMVKQLLSRADAYSAFGLYDESKRQCDKVLLLDGDNSQAWCNLGRIHKTQGHLDQAFGAYLRSTEADPNNVPAQFELGMMYVKEGSYRQAISHLDQVRRCRSDKTTASPGEPFLYHKASLDLLLQCYEQVDDQAKAQFTREEIRVFYPHHTSTEGDAVSKR